MAETSVIETENFDKDIPQRNYQKNMKETDRSSNILYIMVLLILQGLFLRI